MNEAIKKRSDTLIRASLSFIAQDGWSWAALLKGADEAGYDSAVLDLCFEGDVKQALAHYSAMLDEEMIAKAKALPLETFKTRDRIRTCIIARLEAMDAHKEAARKAIRYLPFHGILASKLVYKTVDAMWYAADDKATDFSFYTKRATLAAVYTSTLLYWLQDESGGFTKTLQFLDHRLNNIMMIPKVKQAVRRFFGK
jgi:ubiquinone biosynthesis protein COQ9